jgi:hypothetical protein
MMCIDFSLNVFKILELTAQQESIHSFKELSRESNFIINPKIVTNNN